VLVLLAPLPAGASGALSGEVETAIRALIGEAAPKEGGVALRAPETAENGAFVPVTVSVDSTMMGDDRCVAIHLVATANPTPGIASFQLGKGLARAEISTRIRLAAGQTVLAFAVMADGSVRRASAQVAVTTGGCVT
jgi:sulfur-oxidizing protein SoxY